MKKLIPFCAGIWIALLTITQLAVAQALPDFTVLVEDNAPAIVSISTETNFKEAGAGDFRIEEFLRRFGDEQLPEGIDRNASGMGSGFIIESDGYIVTNHHVVQGADKIKVVLNDRREFQAELIGSDERSDLALLKIDTQHLPVVALGTSSNLKVGEWVLAIGSPFGLSYSVAAGIISFNGRNLPSQGLGNYVSFIQTDVAINPGHSGGPLFNLNGEVIGINSQIFSNTGASIGLSFAIPVDVAKNVIQQLKENGEVQRGWMGVAINDVSQQQADEAGMDRPRGAFVAQVLPDSPAEAAGFSANDIIVSFEGSDIISSGDLPFYVGMLPPGSSANINLIREGSPMTIVMEVGGIPIPESQTVAEQTISEPNLIGLIVVENTLSTEGGLLVLDVMGGAGKKAGLLPNDILLSLSGVEINSVDGFNSALQEQMSGSLVPLLVSRQGEQSFFSLRIP